MKFLNPAGLWLLLGVPVLIVVYLIKSRHEERPVSSTYIWQLSARFMKKRLPLQKIKKLLMFLMQFFVIIALALIAARPAVNNGEAVDYILIIDSSASMQISDTTGTSRFEYAKQQAEEIAEEISNGHTISMISASNTASYLVQTSTSLNEVRLSLENLDCTSGTLNLTEALNLAKLLADHVSNPEVIFFTDREYEAENVEVINLDKNEWNVAIEALSANTSGKNTTFTGKLTSYHGETSVTVGLSIDGSVVDAKIVDCAEDTETSVTFEAEGVSSFDHAEIFIETSDALELDNRYAICRGNEKTYGVLLVSASPLYLESALKALGNCEVTVKNSLADAELSGFDLYIFDGLYPDEYPTDGSVIQFGADKLPEGLSVDETFTAEEKLSKNTDLVSELYDNLILTDTVISKYSGLLGNAYWSRLLYCGDSVVLANKKLGNSLYFSVFSFDIHDSNLPLQMDFIPLMQNIVEYSVPGLLKNTDRTVGDTVRLTVMPAAEMLFVECPDDSILTLSTASDTASVIVDEVGLYTAAMTTADGGEYVDFFVHLAKGEVVSTAGGKLELEIVDNTTLETENAIAELWFWIVLAVLLLILIEWGWYYHEQY